MQLPNAENAIVEIEKLRDYCLNPTHPRGRNKARVFQSVLGITAEHIFELQEALLQAARQGAAVERVSDWHGMRYTIDFVMTHNERTATIRSAWIVPEIEGPTRLLTRYIL